MKWRVTSKESGWTLLQFLRYVFPEHSAKMLKRELEAQRCQVNGRMERFSSTLVGTGDEIVFSMFEKAPAKNKPSVRHQKPVYEDSYLKIINKPVGVSVETLSKSHPDCILVHRLDKPTSGLLIFAKNETVFQVLVASFRNKLIDKTYLTLVFGKNIAPKGKIENLLGRVHSMSGQAIWGAVEKGLPALTFWRLLQEGKQGAFLEVMPVTGRTHQIRTHLASVGMPLAGDLQYAHGMPYVEAPRVMLHAYRLRFPHPCDPGIVDVKAEPPEDFILQMQKMGMQWQKGI